MGALKALAPSPSQLLSLIDFRKQAQSTAQMRLVLVQRTTFLKSLVQTRATSIQCRQEWV